ncbi:unnamed protein product [Ceutorhynchus assimilis]|uniref:BTB domain-containing protein n=1 Tax=Ceutorhynchus assimilis TaxID=467358 RepID=A0A9N9QN76_9CUCU|nr:unnamed protein product [Ceutorhynchus assimilis]
MSKQFPVPDCTPKCQSTVHGDLITAAITKRSISDKDLSSYLTHICHCCGSVKDSDGRTALHVAASCGRTALVSWLLKSCHANINARDKESGYTALHRSVFYGKIDTVVELIKLGASLTLQDSNGLSFLEHAMLDRYLPPNCYSCARGELFTWGSNSNMSLGSQLSRTIPETMDIFHKEYPNENVKQIFINQFHSVILTELGSVYSCGHGQGGRLGLGIQQFEVTPKVIKFPTSSKNSEAIKILCCSIARDHSLFLAATGELYSCGLNKHKVLGIAPPPDELLAPKPLKYLADMPSFVATGNYHSLIWNKSNLFTWGLNAGQLGHQLNNSQDDKYILTPKRVKCIKEQDQIKLVSASTGATVVYTEKGDVYVLHEYQCRKIASRQLNLVQITVIGGKLNHKLDEELSDKTRELKVAALTNTGNVCLWQENDPVLRRCIFSINRALNIKQMSFNINNLLFVTNDGEAFKGEAKPRKKKVVDTNKNATKSDFHKFLEKDECLLVKLEKIPRIHRGLSIQSDPKGLNFAIIQDRPYKYLSKYDVTESTMLENMFDLFTTAEDFGDVELKVNDTKFMAHKFILATKSHYFANLFKKNQQQFEFKGFNAQVFEEFLKYIYIGTTELIEIGELQNESLIRLCQKPQVEEKENDVIIDGNKSAFEYYSLKDKVTDNAEKKLDNPVRMLHEMAKRFEVIELQKILSNLDMVKTAVRLKRGGKQTKRGPIIFNKNLFPQLYDVEIHCKNDMVLRAHKCILVARLDYFCSMFSARWNRVEASKITMPFPKEVVEALLEFLYTDSLDRLEDRDVDQLFKIIILADQFFVTRLKDQCEIILSNMLTIKNTCQLLMFADIYNADSLKENCFEFIQQNMTPFLEMRLLDELDGHLLKELSDFYQVRRQLDCRVITPYSTAVTDQEISHISFTYPVDIKEMKEKQKSIGGSKKRVRAHKTSSSDKHVLSQSLESDSNLHNISFSSDIQEELSVSIEEIESPLANRVKAITIANKAVKYEEIEENFTVLRKKSENLSGSFVDSFEFPLLSSPPKSSGFGGQRTTKLDFKMKPVKLSQKQRKRLSSESNPVVTSPALTESPKNPWKILQDPISPINSPQNDNIEAIMSREKKQKENLVKITSKPLAFTQLEDKAIEELRKFYSVDIIEEELITIERASMGDVAVPVWVPKTR